MSLSNEQIIDADRRQVPRWRSWNWSRRWKRSSASPPLLRWPSLLARPLPAAPVEEKTEFTVGLKAAGEKKVKSSRLCAPSPALASRKPRTWSRLHRRRQGRRQQGRRGEVQEGSGSRWRHGRDQVGRVLALGTFSSAVAGSWLGVERPPAFCVFLARLGIGDWSFVEQQRAFANPESHFPIPVSFTSAFPRADSSEAVPTP
jgi:hypothetical protein